MKERKRYAPPLRITSREVHLLMASVYKMTKVFVTTHPPLQENYSKKKKKQMIKEAK